MKPEIHSGVFCEMDTINDCVIIHIDTITLRVSCSASDQLIAQLIKLRDGESNPVILK